MKIAICGFGTVGSGVYEILSDSKDIEVVKVFNRYNEKKKMLLGDKFTDNILDIYNDQSIELVVETMGGYDTAYEIISHCLKHHKHVVTANKEVVALKLNELLELARTNNVMFLFEASVGGGIPIVKGVSELSSFDEITNIYGILNGTTNYMLSNLKSFNFDFEGVLKKAQELGYAEADPTSDLEGLDMLRKIAILSMLAKNTVIDINSIYHRGITNLNSKFIEKLYSMGYTVKLISDSNLENNSIKVYPVAVLNDSVIANTKDANNIIFVNCIYNGLLSFSGMGAGKLPTASSIVNDIKNIIDGNTYLHYSNPSLVNIDNSKEQSSYFIYENDEVKRIDNALLKDLEEFEFVRIF